MAMRSLLISSALFAMVSCQIKHVDSVSSSGITDNNANYYRFRCIDGQFDAFSYIEDGHYYAFRRGYCMQISPSGYLKGNVMRIADKFPGIPNDLDAVVTWTLTRRTKARTYFFKGDYYWTQKEGKITGPRRIECGFQGVPGNVDAVFIHGTDTIFVKGDLFYRYIRGDESLPPIKKSDSEYWKYLPRGINAISYNYHNQHTFYFIGKFYIRLNRYDKQVTYGYPRIISEHMLKCN